MEQDTLTAIRDALSRLDHALNAGALQEGSPAVVHVRREMATLQALVAPPCSGSTLTSQDEWAHGRE